MGRSTVLGTARRCPRASALAFVERGLGRTPPSDRRRSRRTAPIAPKRPMPRVLERADCRPKRCPPSADTGCRTSASNSGACAACRRTRSGHEGPGPGGRSGASPPGLTRSPPNHEPLVLVGVQVAGVCGRLTLVPDNGPAHVLIACDTDGAWGGGPTAESDLAGEAVRRFDTCAIAVYRRISG